MNRDVQPGYVLKLQWRIRSQTGKQLNLPEVKALCVLIDELNELAPIVRAFAETHNRFGKMVR